MKSLFLFSFLLFAINLSYAQEALQPGNRVIGGSLSMNLQSLASDNNTNSSTGNTAGFEISPSYSKVIEQNKMIGVQIQFGTQYRKNRSDTGTIPRAWADSKNVTFGTGFFYKRYLPISEKIGVFLQPGAYYNTSISNRQSKGYDSIGVQTGKSLYKTTSHNVFAKLDIGLSYFVTEKLSLETNLGYFSAGFSRNKNASKGDNLPTKQISKGDALAISGSFINNLSLSQLFTINYFF